MITLSPFQFKHVFFLQGSKHFITCLELDENIEFKNNGLILITGKSGGGKSTFLNILKGLIPFHMAGEFSGEIRVNNVLLTKENVDHFNREVVYLFQNPFSQLIHQDAKLELAFTMENLKFSHEKFEEKQKQILEKFNLKNRIDVPTNQLSNGECQKLVLGSLIALSPKIILLDEPTAFLDPESRKNFYEILAELKKNHIIFLVDHHVDEVKHLADQFILIENKKIRLNESIDLIQKENIVSVDYVFPQIKEKIEFAIHNLNFSYDSKREILKNVNLKAKSGECVVIKGGNGQGKSTLFKIMSGIIPDKHSIAVKVDNVRIKQSHLYRISGFVFQNPENNFFFNTLKEEVMNDSNNDLLKIFFDKKDFDRSPYLFSEGQKRRLSILINLALNKKILFLDEPTFGQDEENKKMIATLVRKLKNAGVLIFVISHDEKFIKSVANRTYELKDGFLNEIT